jgi:nicotinamidase-related amidase
VSRASLHGSAPDRHHTALLIVDVINDLEFPGGSRLLPAALRMARHLTRLSARCRSLKIPVVYANDNFGRWRSDFRRQIRHVMDDGVRGQAVARLLMPEEHDYFVLKVKNSAFYGTVLEALLRHLGTRRLIITGLTTESCILFTACEAYLRELEIVVPRDCVIPQRSAVGRQALKLMSLVLKADTTLSGRLRI